MTMCGLMQNSYLIRFINSSLVIKTMPKSHKTYPLAISKGFFAAALVGLSLPLCHAALPTEVTDASKTVHYYSNGKLAESLSLTLGDPQEWGQAVEGLSGQSEGGKVRIKPEDFRSKGDAMRGTWSDDTGRGELAIYGPALDLSAVKDSYSLVFNVRVHTQPTQSVKVGMDCGYPCRAEYDIGGILRAIPEETWTSLPLPLSCFKSEDFDLSKISGLFMLSTAGKMDVSITNIRVEKTPEDLEDCPAVPEEPAAAVGLNPTFFYFINGELIGPRGIILGDPGKWGQSIEGTTGRSATGKIQVKTEDFQGKDDAMRITWSRNNVKGELGIYGPPIDIEAYRDKAALTFDVKTHNQPRESVKVGMDCEYPCRAEFEIGLTLRRMNRDTWTSLPIPLNCLSSSNFDLSKINGVFLISTSGRLDLSIANIRLEQLPEGSEGCK